MPRPPMTGPYGMGHMHQHMAYGRPGMPPPMRMPPYPMSPCPEMSKPLLCFSIPVSVIQAIISSNNIIIYMCIVYMNAYVHTCVFFCISNVFAVHTEISDICVNLWICICIC